MISLTQELLSRVIDLPYKEPELCDVAICTPFYKASSHVFRYLDGLEHLDWDKSRLALNFLISEDPVTLDILKEYKKSFDNLYKSIKIKETKRLHGVSKVKNITVARKHLVQMSKPYDVFFIDSDVVVTPKSLKKLKNINDSGHGISGGLYLMLNSDSETKELRIGVPMYVGDESKSYYLGFARLDGGEIHNGIFNKRINVDALATGCMLIKREVLDKIPFRYNIDGPSEDLDFCFSSKKLGYDIIADTSILCQHTPIPFKIESNMVKVFINRNEVNISMV